MMTKSKIASLVIALFLPIQVFCEEATDVRPPGVVTHIKCRTFSADVVSKCALDGDDVTVCYEQTLKFPAREVTLTDLNKYEQPTSKKQLLKAGRYALDWDCLQIPGEAEYLVVGIGDFYSARYEGTLGFLSDGKILGKAKLTSLLNSKWWSNRQSEGPFQGYVNKDVYSSKMGNM